MVKNPREVSFDPSPDHDQIQGYELDIRDADGAVVQTLDLGKGSLVGGRVVASVNVQPTKFGQYTFAARATAGDEVESDTSDPSEVWQRSPGKPGQPAAA